MAVKKYHISSWDLSIGCIFTDIILLPWNLLSDTHALILQLYPSVIFIWQHCPVILQDLRNFILHCVVILRAALQPNVEVIRPVSSFWPATALYDGVTPHVKRLQVLGLGCDDEQRGRRDSFPDEQTPDGLGNRGLVTPNYSRPFRERN